MELQLLVVAALEEPEEVGLAICFDPREVGDPGKSAGDLEGDEPRADKVLEFWKRVLVSSDESVDLLVVKLAPEMLLFVRKMAEVEMFTAQKLGSD